MKILSAIFIFMAASVAWAGDSPKTDMKGSVYQIKNGSVVFPGYDGHISSGTEDLILNPKDFTGPNVYRDEMLLQVPPMVSKKFLVPDKATTLSLTGRSRTALDVFPRLRVTMIAGEDEKSLFEGYWQTISEETTDFTIPLAMAGKSASLKIEILNPVFEDEQRTFYFLRAVISQ